MATTYEAIATVTVGSGGAANIEFTSIPQTYTDLLVKYSLRGSGSVTGARLSLNGSNANFTNRYLEGNGATVSSGNLSQYIGAETPSGATASTFSNGELYIPNYTSSNNKSISSDNVSENNGTTAYATFNALLWSNSATITSLGIFVSGVNFAQYSTATLYGIRNS